MGEPTTRQQRVARQIAEVLSEVITFEVEDPGLSGLTIMDVTIDKELKYAKIYVTSLSGSEARRDVMTGLERAKGFLRRKLGDQLTIQFVPELRFEWDETLERAEKINRLLDSLDIPPEEDDESDTAS